MHQPYDYLSLLEEMHLFTELVFDTKCILFNFCLSSDGKKLEQKCNAGHYESKFFPLFSHKAYSINDSTLFSCFLCRFIVIVSLT